MEKNKVKLNKDDKCRICNQALFSDGKLIRNILEAKDYGIVHDECFLPYLPESELKILMRLRCYSMGDSIAVTPVLRELKRNYPRCKLTLLTFYPDLFKYNPNVDFILDANQTIYNKQINDNHLIVEGFDSEKGNHFAMHSVSFAAISCFFKEILPINWDYELYYQKEEYESMIKKITEHGITSSDKIIAINQHQTEWPTRDWGKTHAKKLVDQIRMKYPDYKIVSIGGKRSDVPSKEMKNYILLEGVLDLYGKFSLLESAAFLDLPSIKLLITPDTGTLHLGATRKELPMVGIFTLIKAHFRTPVRNGVYSYKFIGVESDSGCNCTYTNRQFTDAAQFIECPKRKFLEKTLESDLPIGAKINGLNNFDKKFVFTEKNYLKELKNRINYYDRNNLPCFPSVSKVMRAVEVALEKFQTK